MFRQVEDYTDVLSYPYTKKYLQITSMKSYNAPQPKGF